jgi:hypothetical protein
VSIGSANIACKFGGEQRKNHVTILQSYL